MNHIVILTTRKVELFCHFDGVRRVFPQCHFIKIQHHKISLIELQKRIGSINGILVQILCAYWVKSKY